MKIKTYILKSALIFSALFLLSDNASGQDDVMTLLPGSEYVEMNFIPGVHRLIGNVNFLYQGNDMYCDSAYYYEDSKVVRAYGHVHINKRDTLNLFCDSLVYNGNTRKAKLWGNVRVRDNEYKLTTDTLDYDARQGQAHYHHGGRVESIVSREVLTSRIGYFHPESKNFFFSQDVNYVGESLSMTTDTLKYMYSNRTAYFFGPTNIEQDSTTMYCESGWYHTETGEGSLVQNAWISRPNDYMSGDTLLYNPKEKLSIGIGNVHFQDSINKMGFEGDYAYSSDSLGYSFITGHAVAVKEMNDDTLYIHADTLYSLKIDTNYVMKAYYGARIFSNSMQGYADSIVFSQEEERVRMYDSPIIWSNGSELKGTYMEMHVSDSMIHKVHIIEKASILMEVEPEKYYNQIAGKEIEAFFNDNKLYKAFSNGNAMTIFFPEDEQETDTSFVIKRMGMNRLYSSTLRIDVDSNKVTGISYIEEPDGAFYPMDQLNLEEQFIPGFNWRYALRPKTMEDLFKEDEVVVEEIIEEEYRGE
ncbi:MAG: OstA-like protein [Crocinitomicaceae bacterium]|nr:OstA-like protein [Crocinitomicaceae bacterium]